MSSEHKRPLYAFAIVAMLCAFFVGSGLRSDAMQGLLRVAEIPVSLDLLERTEKAPDEEPSPEPTSAPGSSPLLTSRSQTPVLPAATSRAPRTRPAVVTPAVDTGTQHAARPAVAKDETGQSASRSGKTVKPGKSKRLLHGKGNIPGHAKGRHGPAKGKHAHEKSNGWNKPAHPRGHRSKGHAFGRKGAQEQAWRHDARRVQRSGHSARARGNQTSQQWPQGRSKSNRHAPSVRGKASSRSVHALKVNRGQAKKASVRIRTSKAASGWHHGKGRSEANGNRKGNRQHG